MLNELKKEVLRVARMAEERGLCHHGGGNFSMIDRDKGLFVITPSAVSRFSIDYDDMLVIDLDLNIVENKGNLKPSSETLIHGTLLKNRTDINAVCHTHARHASAFASLNKPVKPVIIEALYYGAYCNVAPFQLPGSKELAEGILKTIEGTKAVIMQHHGLLTIGSDIYDAYLKSEYVEDVAEICLKVASIVGFDNIPHLSDEQIKYMFDNNIGF